MVNSLKVLMIIVNQGLRSVKKQGFQRIFHKFTSIYCFTLHGLAILYNANVYTFIKLRKVF